jgi:glycosyltransferase involved in cell wall biosynthesis
MMQRRLTEPLHIINPMRNIGGSELRAISLYRVLKRYARVTIWTEETPHPELARMAPIRKIALGRLSFPHNGTFIFIGAYFEVRRWWPLARPGRTILLYNILNRLRLHYMLDRLRLGGKRDVELVYASELLRDDTGLPGVVEDSPIDLELYKPAQPVIERQPDRFVAGRASRDELPKFSELDPLLFCELAQRDIDVRIVGGTCLADRLDPHPRISLRAPLPPADLPPFIRELDCFVYRTSANLVEAYGRVIAEAMACGVTPIIGSSAGIARHIEPGVNGFVADSNEEVLDIIMQLKSNPALRARIGAAARDTMEGHYSESRLAAIAAYYLHDPAPGAARAATPTDRDVTPPGQPHVEPPADGIVTSGKPVNEPAPTQVRR